MFVAWVTRHMTSEHILLCQQITMRAEWQHFCLLVEVVNAGHVGQPVAIHRASF